VAVQADVRRAMAFIAAKLNGSLATSVYDYSESKHFLFSGSVGTDHVSVYDHTQNCHVTGTLPVLFHHGRRQHVDMDLDGNQFSGLDHGTGSRFEGSVSGRMVSLFDYGQNCRFDYFA